MDDDLKFPTTFPSLSLRSPPPAASDARQPSCLLPTFSFTHGDRRALARRADHAKWRRLGYKLRAPKTTPSGPLSARGLPALPGPPTPGRLMHSTPSRSKRCQPAMPSCHGNMACYQSAKLELIYTGPPVPRPASCRACLVKQRTNERQGRGRSHSRPPFVSPHARLPLLKRRVDSGAVRIMPPPAGLVRLRRLGVSTASSSGDWDSRCCPVVGQS
jgi:hypothetical protein